MIVVENVSKIYSLYKKPVDRLKEALTPFKKKYHKDFHALKEISFRIDRGEVVGIIGKNGSGKSTLLKIITGVIQQTKGRVVVHGKVTALLELGAGFNPELTGRENIYFQASIMGYAQIESKVDEIIAFADIGQFIDQKVKLYSSGMRARLGFALSINVEPEVLIIDEALSVGDIAFQRKCFAQIEHFCKDEHKTVLFVSHSTSHITELCDRAIWLHESKLFFDGNPNYVTNLYQKYSAKKNLTKEYILKQEQKTTHQQDSFVQKLLPKSTVIYPQNGAKIFDVKLLNAQGELVNRISKGQRVTFFYKVTFQNLYKDANITIYLKSMNGTMLAGKQIPLVEARVLQKIEKERVYQCSWSFLNRLNKGVYFFNCAVNTHIQGEKEVLHRIIDAYMIEVVDSKSYAKGYIDFDYKLNVGE